MCSPARRAPHKCAITLAAIHTFNFFGFLRRMRRTVLYLSGGGASSRMSQAPARSTIICSNLRYAKRTGNRTVLYGCGIGPVTRSHNRVSAGQYINNYADLVLLREPSSAQELHSMGVVQPEIRHHRRSGTAVAAAGFGRRRKRPALRRPAVWRKVCDVCPAALAGFRQKTLRLQSLC